MLRLVETLLPRTSYTVGTDVVVRGSERVKASEDAGMPRKPLTLVAQPPELPQLDLAQGRPTPEEKRHTVIATTLRISKLFVVEQQEVLRKVLDHLVAASQRPQAPAPYGTFAGLPSRPNQFRILADKLRVTCISTSLPPPSAHWPVTSTRKERLGKRNGSRSPAIAPPREASDSGTLEALKQLLLPS